MADDKLTKSERVIEGELVRGSAPGYASPVRRTLTRLVSRLSILPFFNRMSKRAIDSATEVLEAQTKLGGAFSANQLMADRLDAMPTIIADARTANGIGGWGRWRTAKWAYSPHSRKRPRSRLSTRACICLSVGSTIRRDSMR